MKSNTYRLKRVASSLFAAAGIVVALASHAEAELREDLTEAIRLGAATKVRDIVRETGDPDVQLDSFGTTPLRLAAVRGESEIVRILLDAGARVEIRDYRGVTALSAAVRSCRSDVATIDLLISAGADLENRSGAGLTPLMAAIQDERNDIARHLIRRGGSVQATNVYGDGVLNYAIYYRMPDIIEMALDRQVDTGQLKLLYRNDRYYFPNFGQARPYC